MTSSRTRACTAALLALPALAGLFLPPPPAAADPSDPPTPDLRDVGAVVDQLVPDQLAAGDIPGAVVTVVADGQTVFSSGYGVADPATGTPMDPADTGLYTASEGKLFTATAIMQLVEEGELDLHTDVNEYLDTPIPDTYPGQPVTLHHLLTYTSGFDYDIYGWSQWDEGELPTLAEFATEVRPDRVRPPGELAAYNNYDFVLAGRIIEIVSGQSYADYIAEHVLEPAGMSSTTSERPHPAELQARATPGYRPAEGGHVQAGAQVSPATPAGTGTLTTGADMGRFMIAQLSENSPLGTEATQTMQAEQFRPDPEVPGMGYAFEQRPMNGQQVVTKDGDQPGTHHNLALLPEHDIGIHVAYNGDGTDGAAFWGGKELVRAILDASFPPGENGAPEATDQATAGDVENLAGSYRAARTSQETFTKVTSLTGPVTVTATGPGTISTTGLAEDPDGGEQTWQQTSPGHFVLDGGTATLAVTEAGALVTSQMPNNSFVPLPWYEAPMLHLVLLGVTALILLAGFVTVPVRAVLGRVRERERGPLGGRVAQGLTWLNGLCLVLFAAGFVLVSSDANLLAQIPLTGSPALSFALNTMSVMAAVTLATIVLTVVAWSRSWWSVTGRIALTVTTLAATGFVAVAIFYRLIGVPFVLTV